MRASTAAGFVLEAIDWFDLFLQGTINGYTGIAKRAGLGTRRVARDSDLGPEVLVEREVFERWPHEYFDGRRSAFMGRAHRGDSVREGIPRARYREHQPAETARSGKELRLHDRSRGDEQRLPCLATGFASM